MVDTKCKEMDYYNNKKIWNRSLRSYSHVKRLITKKMDIPTKRKDALQNGKHV